MARATSRVRPSVTECIRMHPIETYQKNKLYILRIELENLCFVFSFKKKIRMKIQQNVIY
jgi:hypothetical protein